MGWRFNYYVKYHFWRWRWDRLWRKPWREAMASGRPLKIEIK